MKHLSYSPALPFLCLLLTAGSLVGCSSSFSTALGTPAPAPLNSGTGDIRGGAYGGRQPILGAHVYLYGATNTGYTVPTGSSGQPTAISGISLLGNTVGGCQAADNLYADSNGNCYYLTGTGSDVETPANTTDNGGSFNLTGLYQCNVKTTNAATGTLPGQQVWLYSVGGDPGVGQQNSGSPAPSNPAAGLTAALGTCPSSNNFTTLPFIFMNEVSTTAFAYALAPFAYDATHISAPATNYTTGLANAFLNAAQLYDIGGGIDPGDHSGARYNTPNGLGSNPYILINSLADVYSNCINSANTASSPSTPCTQLFTNYTTGTPTPTDTASAAIAIAKNPGYTDSTTTPKIFFELNSYEPFHPAYNDPSPYTNPNNGVVTSIPKEPYDLTAAILFSGGSINLPAGIVAGPLGNVYVGMYGNGTITQISSVGNQTNSTANPANPYGATSLTIDYRGNLWSVDANNGNLIEINNTTGTNYNVNNTTFGCEAAGNNCPTVSNPVNTYLTNGYLATSGAFPPSPILGITADAAGDVYIADTVNQQVVKESAPAPYTTTVYTTNSLGYNCPKDVAGVAIDGSNYLWSVGSKSICRISPTGTVANYKTINDPGYAVAIDRSGNGWVTFPDIPALAEFTPSSGSPLPVGFSTHNNSGGGLGTPGLVAIDGNNNIFVLNGYDTNYTTPDQINGALPSLVEFAGKGVFPPASATALSPANYGYQSQQLSYPSGIAVDISGNVWISNGSAGDPYANTISEIIGVGAPTESPTLNNPGTPEVKVGAEQQ